MMGLKMKDWISFLICGLMAWVAYSSPVRSAVGGRTLAVTPNIPKPSYTCEDYVQDGLLCMWDGIENAGLGLHDNSATVWVDLTGNGFDLTVDPTCGEWGENCIIPYSNCGCPAYRRNAQSEFNSMKRYPYQVEVVTKGPYGGGTAMIIVGLTYCDSQYQQVICMYSHVGKRYKGWPVPVTQVPQSFSVNLNEGYANGVFCGTQPLSIGIGSWGRLASDICIAGVAPLDSETNRSRGYPYWWPIFTIRVYSRNLTEEEILWNWKIDKARFGL